MNYRFYDLTKKAFAGLSLAVVCVGFTACHEDYKLDDEGNRPEWLGSSIYESLKNPDQKLLTGTFNNYLRLADDMGYAETLARTGSKTVFPANDEAFERFFKNNSWGVHRYEDLTDAMKKQLLYSSMLDNAILVEMMSNVPATDGTYSNVQEGIAMRHVTGANIIDTITHISRPADMPQNNSYWEDFYESGIDMVMDGTTPMMMHFTKEQLQSNGITTDGPQSDFAVITGSEYSEGMAYVYRNKVIHSDVTCQNGYIQQLEDVLVPPGNVAEVIRQGSDTKYFSRMLERFAVPVTDMTTTNNYNDYVLEYNKVAAENGKKPLSPITRIYQKRYLSNRSQGANQFKTDPYGKQVNSFLAFDPGWNTYYPEKVPGNLTYKEMVDAEVMFVPTDAAFEDYFLRGSGMELLRRYGTHEPLDDANNLMANIDDIDLNIVKDLLNNLMKPSFIESVPSKFDFVVKSGSGDPMQLTLNDLEYKDGKYDVKIGNNGVIYMLNKVFPPDDFSAVSAPVLFSTEMNIMHDAINDGKTGVSTGNGTNLAFDQNYFAYLLAMNSNYGFFIPLDKAFETFYVDPVALGAGSNSRAFKFFYNKDVESGLPYICCSKWRYNPNTGEVGDSIPGLVSKSEYKSQLIDILNLHTIVLEEGEKIGSKKYYKSKNGAAILIDLQNMTVASGAQIDNGRPVSHIVQTYNQANGTSYSLDHPIEAPHNSVYKILESDERFSKFMALCLGRSEDGSVVRSSCLTYAGYSPTKKNGVSEQTRFEVFTETPNGARSRVCLDNDVAYFSSYNYTVYAPDNEAMEKAFRAGLPSWDDVVAEMNRNDMYSKGRVQAMCETINNFIRYHFQTNSVFVDNIVENGNFSTFCLNENNVAYPLKVGGGNGVLTVTDNTGNTIEIKEAPGKMTNQMARDMVYNKTPMNLQDNFLVTSSFSIIHEVSTPLNPFKNLPAGAEKTSDGIYRYDYDIHH